MAPQRSEFLNVYLVTYGSVLGYTFIAATTQVVVNLWEHDPHAEVKICHQWILTDNDLDNTIDTVQAESLTENRWNVVQEIQEIPVPPQDLEEYSVLYRRCVGYLLKRMGLATLDDFYQNL